MSDKWIDHEQGPMPVSPTTVVTVEMENGDELIPMEARDIDWDFEGDAVVKYKIEENP
jgi:hypothetical protein|tara:strand:+ start:49 stop:222 length:174 start_codon:yes stop_codon:yes gene_type:complete